MTELEQFRAMLRAHSFSEAPLDEEEAPGYVTVLVVPDVHKQMLIRFTFDDDGDFDTLYPDWPANWKVTVQ